MTRFGRITVLAVLAVVAGLLHLRAAQPASAADGVCWLGADGTLECPTDEPQPPVAFAPADLVSPNMLPAYKPWADSVRALEKQAVDLVVQERRLPAGDADAVRTWGRYDALASLWGLVVRAIKTPEANRSVDQQRAVFWMANLVRAQAMNVARVTGEQYVRWAGLNLVDYWQMVDDGAGVEQLIDFFTTTAQPYNGSDGTSGSTGFCTYRSPEPFADEYQGFKVQTCYTACTSWVCEPPRPSFDQFTRWGNAIATRHLTDPRGVSNAAALAQAALTNTALVGTAGALASAAVGVAAATGAYVALAADMTAYLLSGPTQLILTYGATATAYAGMAAPIAIVAGSIIGGVMAGIQLGEELQTPGQLASLIVGARQANYDPAAMIATSDGTTTLFAAFAATAAPTPRLDQGCDNSLIPGHLYGSTVQDQATIRDASGKVITVSTYPCLNQTPIPTTGQDDPHFMVREVATGKVVAQPALSVRLKGTDGVPDQTLSLRASDEWWVASVGDGPAAQALSVTYTGWDGRPRTASIAKDITGYSFRGLTQKGLGTVADPSTCLVDQTCWAGHVLRYVGPDGRWREAILVAPIVGMPLTTVNPTAGERVGFAANQFGPAGATGVIYEWRFQAEGCSGPCTPPITRDVTGYTWSQPGTYSVELRATYRQGWPPAVYIMHVKIAAAG